MLGLIAAAAAAAAARPPITHCSRGRGRAHVSGVGGSGVWMLQTGRCVNNYTILAPARVSSQRWTLGGCSCAPPPATLSAGDLGTQLC